MNNKHMQYAACAVVGMVAGVILAIVLHLAASYIGHRHGFTKR